MIALISFVTGNFKNFIVFSLIIFIHECGHLSMALYFKWNVKSVVILPFGGLTIFEDDINKPLKEEFLILIMGPLIQILFTVFYRYNEIIVNYSITILSFNLLPIYPLDGARLINIILNKFISFKKSHLLTLYISILTIILFIIRKSYNLMFILILTFIFSKTLKEFINHKNIFNRFLLERYIKDFNFKKRKIIKSKNINKMKRDYIHFFYNGKRYITEKEMLKKRFDFKRKRW